MSVPLPGEVRQEFAAASKRAAVWTQADHIVKWFAWSFFCVFASVTTACFVYVCLRLPRSPSTAAPVDQVARYQELCSGAIGDSAKLFLVLGLPSVLLLAGCIAYLARRRD